MPACLFPGERISPVRALTMKDYENQITGLKKENFNLKLRIYFMEERMQQKFDDSAEDIFKTNIELKVEVESQKRELAEKQELLVSAWKALESLEGKESSEIFHVKEEANREREQLKNFYNKRIRQLEEDLKAAEDEVEKMATIAEQEKVRNIGMEKQLLAFGLSSTFTPAPTQDVHHVLQEKDRLSGKNLGVRGPEMKERHSQLRGSQCRWIFSSSGKRNLQVVLSYILGSELTRDGHSEFLCSKCVYMLERVVQCDVIIGQLQDAHSFEVQKLQVEKENLVQCISHIYWRHNARPEKSKDASALSKHSSMEPMDSLAYRGPVTEDHFLHGGNYSDMLGEMKRCMNCDSLGGTDVHLAAGFPFRKLATRRTSRSQALKKPRSHSQSMYLELIHSKSSVSGIFQDRSFSLPSLILDCQEPSGSISGCFLPATIPLQKNRVDGAQSAIQKPMCKSRRWHGQRNSPTQVSIVSELLSLLQSIQRHPVIVQPKSKIPVLLKYSWCLAPDSHYSQSKAQMARKKWAAEWKSLEDLTDDFDDEYMPLKAESLINKQNEATALEAAAKQLTEELNSTKALIQNLKKTLEDEENENKILCMKLEEKENELSSEKKNALKRDKTIQGLTLVLKEKDKEIEELCHEIEDRDEALAKAREAAHKAQIQKYQASFSGAEEHQSLLMEKQGELENLQLEHHGKVLEAQKLQRALQHREKELGSLQQAKEQLEQELEDLQQLKKKGDKAINDLQNKLKKLNGEMGERENALEQQYQALLDESKRKLQAHELTIQRLSSNLSEKEHQLQEYMKLIKDQEQRKSPGGSDILLAKLRERLKEKEAALEQAIDEKFVAIEEKDSEICQLQLSLREKERDLERLNKLLLHNEETINSFDALIKEKDVELQHLANSLKNLQRLKNELEDNLSRTLREKDTIISQLQLTVDEKSKDLEEMARSLLSQTQSNARDLAEHLSQQLKVAEAKLAEAMKDKERLVSDNENAVEGLIATINSKDQLLKETAEHYNRTIAERTQEIQDLKRQLTENRHLLATAEKQSAMTAQEKCIESAELRVMLTEKDTIINKLLENKEEREKFLEELKIMETPVPQVVELKHTIQVLQECLEEKEAELSRKNNSDSIDKNSVTKTAVILKKELAQKTDALNKALKAENNLKIELAELRSLLADVETQNVAQASSIESLTATLKTKDEIIWVLHERLSKLGDSKVYDFYDQTAEPKEERPLPSLPQRERTIIGGNSQQEVLPALSALLSEHERLNQSLKAEQQLYSDLVRIVKEQDSPQCLHALEMELTAVQLLRQQLEDGIQSNENLRQDLEREIQNAKQREGSESQLPLVDPREMESMRHQLEDAQRWNASLQARLGAIQNRGGGVGGTNDTADTFSFVADQTSYMSICVEDRLNDDLSHLSMAELQQMVLELRDYIKQLQALNQEKKENSSVVEFSDMGLMGKEDSNVPRSALEKLDDEQIQASTNERSDEAASGVNVNSITCQPQRDGSLMNQTRKHKDKRNQEDKEMELLLALLKETGVASVSQLREEIMRLQAENISLEGLLKEDKSVESKESADSSGESIGSKDLQRVVEKLRSEAKSNRKIIKLLKEQLKLNSSTEDKSSFNPELIVNMAREIEWLKAEQESSRRREENLKRMLEGKETETPQHDTFEPLQKSTTSKETPWNQNKIPKRATVKSRLPIPIKHDKMAIGNRAVVSQASDKDLHPLTEELLHMEKKHCSEQMHTAIWNGEELLSTAGRKTSLADTVIDRHSTDIELLKQLELLHNECQVKEQVIAELEEQASKSEELEVKLKEKEHLNRQFVEALQAAESTIQYLTACNLDRDDQAHDSDVHRQCCEFRRALQEKEELNKQLVDCLHVAESAIASLSAFTSDSAAEDILTTCTAPQELLQKLENALQRISASVDESSGYKEKAETLDSQDSNNDLHRQIDQLQEALWEQNRQNAELQERLYAAELMVTQQNNTSGVADEDKVKKVQKNEELKKELIREEANKIYGCGMQNQPKTDKFRKDHELQDQLIQQLAECFYATESAIASLTDCCSQNYSTERPMSTTALQEQLQKLQKALQENGQWHKLYLNSYHQNAKATGVNDQYMDLYHNISNLLRTFTENGRVISELQKALEEQKNKNKEYENLLKTAMTNPIMPDVPGELESLQKALREQKCICQALQEELAVAQSVIAKRIPIQNSHVSHKATSVEQDHKEVQVDLQDLGYETSGKSENELDREESSSTDNDRDLQLTSESTIPSLLRQIPGNYSSMENLETNSSPSYPSSPTISSPKVSLKSLQAFEDYGLSDNPEELRQQVLELKGQLESHQRVIQYLQTLQHQISQSSDLLTMVSDSGTSALEKHSPEITKETRQKNDPKPGLFSDVGSGYLPLNRDEEEKKLMKDHITNLSSELEKERNLNRNLAEQLQNIQFRSRSASPARIDSLVQSQARELSQLRQQIKESRRLGSLQRWQLESLNKAFEELLQASDVDYNVGEVFRKQLDKSLTMLEQLEDRLESAVANTSATSGTGSHHLGTASAPQQHDTAVCGVQHVDPSEATGINSDGKDKLLHTLQRRNSWLQEQLWASEQLNVTLREELDLHRSVQIEREDSLSDYAHDITDKGTQQEGTKESSAAINPVCPLFYKISVYLIPLLLPIELLAEHLQEIRSLRQRLEDTIHTNNQLREQLERKLAELEKDPAATNIFIHGNKEQGQLASEVRLLWGQNQALKDQLNLASREYLRNEFETLKKENSLLQSQFSSTVEENKELQQTIHYSQDEINRLRGEINVQRQQLADSQQLLQSLRVELQVYEQMKTTSDKQNDPSQGTPAPASGTLDLSELLSEIRHLRLQLERSIHTNNALRQKLEEQLLRGSDKAEGPPSTININYLLSAESRFSAHGHGAGSRPLHQCPLLFQMKVRKTMHMMAMTRSIFPKYLHLTGIYPVSIMILPNDITVVVSEMREHVRRELDSQSQYSGSSADSVSPKPSRLVPGHRLWANKSGRHVLGLIEDHNALRKQISEGRKLTSGMDRQLQECFHALSQHDPESRVLDEQLLKDFSTNVNTMQQVLDEAARLLKLVWRVSLPTHISADISQSHKEELLKNEIARLKCKLSQQEKMLLGAVKRLRTTNQLKEGMEKVIIDQLTLTHDVLKRARGNLEDLATVRCEVLQGGQRLAQDLEQAALYRQQCLLLSLITLPDSNHSTCRLFGGGLWSTLSSGEGSLGLSSKQLRMDGNTGSLRITNNQCSPFSSTRHSSFARRVRKASRMAAASFPKQAYTDMGATCRQEVQSAYHKACSSGDTTSDAGFSRITLLVTEKASFTVCIRTCPGPSETPLCGDHMEETHLIDCAMLVSGVEAKGKNPQHVYTGCDGQQAVRHGPISADDLVHQVKDGLDSLTVQNNI
ncbi:CDK5 regulatory subunit-associated protein 2-like [Scleropages formosus]|uniref:CDK5 regulatory subunit-associated protein 2-like n=1 Tax=Scleropages formosus TaxID=113540 RepID=A0A0P7XPG9_SCLFO|nr:CDK5 regulatory subunit-associated protein 2-like [Scleropages formosus]